MTLTEILHTKDASKIDFRWFSLDLREVAANIQNFKGLKLVEEVRPNKYRYIRSALLRIPVPTVYVQQQLDGTYEVFNDADKLSAMITMMKEATEVPLKRRLEETIINFISFNPHTDRAEAINIVNDHTNSEISTLTF